MTAATARPTGEDKATPDVLTTEARALAAVQGNLERAARLVTRLFEPPPIARALDRAQIYFRGAAAVGGRTSSFGAGSADAAQSKASEWFLDNYYLLRRVARQVQDELPRGFVRHLPQLASGPAKGRPRVEALAQALVAKTDLTFGHTILQRFIDAYQEVSPLTIAELWALPTMLRAAVLEQLLRFLDDLHVPVHGEARASRPSAAGSRGSLVLDPVLGVERSVRALRVLDVLDWKDFFEQANRVEVILRTDPAGIYPRMDFETCDSYRKAVEALAWSTGRAEEDVADRAIALARSHAADERLGHVGYYLVAAGRGALEAQIGYWPLGLDRLRRLVTQHPTLAYLAPLAIGTVAPLLAIVWYVAHASGQEHLVSLTLAAVVAAVPTSAVVIALLQLAVAKLLPPRTLPKLDLAKGLPSDARTLVVMPTLLGRSEDVAAVLRQVELHYLANPDPRLQFALLTDDVDATTPRASTEETHLLQGASDGIAALNVKHGKDGHGPFHLLHREPRWNPGEERYMGWERKRGKLEELNRLLRGDTKTSYSRHVGSRGGLQDIRFVVTLDSDTQLPMGSVHRLVGLLAHPLNRAVVDPATGRVVAGYTIIQPRIETSPSSSRPTLFSRLFAGDIGFDIYTHACSELYQDLYGSGIYVGKGIYDVDAFTRSMDDRVPENTLVSHDLFEGVHGRTALATDIVLFEGYPSNYVTYAMRLHRWVRGDWQLVPWLLPRVPSARGTTIPNRLASIDRWKIGDNLRRSLTGPCLVTLLVLAWIWLPGNAGLWTAGVIGLLVAPSLPALVSSRRRGLASLGRSALAVAFLVYEAYVVIDAMVRVLVRKTITRKHLLQWTSAAQASFGIEARAPRALFWQRMFCSPLIAFALLAVLAWLRPSALLAAAPILAVWSLAPEIARWVSQPSGLRAERITPSGRRLLRLIACRTWRFFDAFVGPNDQWLPVDNHQESPREQTAHRTSPTNIGLMLLATLSAYDFGYIGPSELSLRIRRAFDSIMRMPHYQGHLFNWYDTRNLQPLLPRYVSTVDSGNFAGCLVALEQGCKDVAAGCAVRVEAWDGLADSLALLEEVVAALPIGPRTTLSQVIVRMQASAAHARANLHDAYSVLRVLGDDDARELDRELLSFLEGGAQRQDVDLLRSLRTSITGLHRQLEQMRRELDGLLPWLGLEDAARSHAIELPTGLRLHEIPAAARRLQTELEAKESERREHPGQLSDLDRTAQTLLDAFRNADTNATALLVELDALAARAGEEARGMDFRLLYDVQRRLFHIGYNATVDQLDACHYDLLASEARLTSYFAIVKRDVPEAHWYALGRPMTRIEGSPVLLSWGGSMFEYLMPGLLMRSHEGTLLERTSALAVEAQIAHGKRNQEPWGVSESAYARTDADQTYQYRSFGVPGLGLKRGLEEDRVVSSYASLLAVSLRPRAVVDNVRALEALGMVGTYGLFEALDLAPERAIEQPATGHPFTVVHSYMSHHQGMTLVALGNYLNDRTMVDRFHSNAWMESGDVLLNEQAPDVPPDEWPTAEGSTGQRRTQPPGAPRAPRAPAPWLVDQSRPQAFVLSNGRLTSLVTAAGGGGLRWQGLALTRYEPDATCDDQGVWLYVRDDETREIWFATSTQGRTTYAMHQAELHLRSHGVSVHVEVAVAPADDVEVRMVTLHNETDRRRSLTVTSAGRPVLFDATRAPTHPAFSSMFIESERLADLDGILFSRRPQTKEEEPVVLLHRIVLEGGAIAFAGFETERSAFFGRGVSHAAPASLAAKERTEPGHVGAVLDPVMSISARIDLPAKGSATFAFVTAVGRSRSKVVALAQTYGSMHAVRWTFRDAEHESPRRLQRTKVEPALLPTIQRLFSALLYVEPTLRVAPDVRAMTPPCQRRLWGRGISGDDPIVLVRVSTPDAPILRETIAAQRFLRSCGVRLDLVLIDEQASGYVTEGRGALRHVLTECEVDDWRDRHGGVFVIAADQLPVDELRHLEATARVVLHTRDGSLAARLDRRAEAPPDLPRFDATLVDEPDERPRPRPTLQLDNGVGGFTADAREYVIAVGPGAPTPAPWCNVLANPHFGCLVSESSLGMTWSVNSGENRLTPWRNDAVFDTPSEALYLRDEETAAVWSPTPLPAGRTGHTLVRHGAGYTTYERESHGLVQELTVFVPTDASLKVVRLRLRNTRARARRLTATYYAEWSLGSRREGQRPHLTSAFERDHSSLLSTCSWNEEFGGRVAFLASQKDAHGFTTDRTEFLGRRGDYGRPEALERWGLSGRVDGGADPCAALQVHIDLAPGEEVVTHFVLGQSASRQEALDLVAHYRDESVVDAAWESLGAFWDDVLGAVRVRTPDPAMDLMLNRWLLYQTLSSRVFGRTGFYQSSGAFGFRDQLQDVLALVHAAPSIARAHILETAKHQFAEGDVLHWWHPPSGRGVRTRCSDDMAWLPYVTSQYVAATGDTSILDQTTPFLEGEPLKPDEHDRYAEYKASAEMAPLFEHCRRALEHAVTEGCHGLPLMGDGDWNDGMSRVGAEGRGESVWLAWFLCATMEGFADLSQRTGDAVGARRWRRRAASLRTKTAEVAWDGAWYLRAFHDDGSLVGSAKSRECRIDSIAQSWAVLSKGKGERADEQARTAIAEADAQLVREADRLVLLFWPPFDTTAHDPGYVRAYPPGVRENGGQYTHAATWLGFAHAALGDGESAARVFRLLNPTARVRTVEDAVQYRVEPYALAGDIYSYAPWVGRGGWTWYTGAAAWLWRLGVEGILGLRLEDGRLSIDPCIPPSWHGFEAWVRVGERRIHVVVENPARVASGVAEMTLDGVKTESGRVDIDPRSPGTHEVHVRLGADAPRREALVRP